MKSRSYMLKSILKYKGSQRHAKELQKSVLEEHHTHTILYHYMSLSQRLNQNCNVLHNMEHYVTVYSLWSSCCIIYLLNTLYKSTLENTKCKKFFSSAQLTKKQRLALQFSQTYGWVWLARYRSVLLPKLQFLISPNP